MNSKLLVALIFHVLFMMGMLNGFFLAAFTSFDALISGYTFDPVEIITVLVFIVISELIVSLRFGPFRMERKKYSEKAYMIRRLIRTFFVTIGIYYLMFRPEGEGALIVVVPLILYYIYRTPNSREFRRFTSS